MIARAAIPWFSFAFMFALVLSPAPSPSAAATTAGCASFQSWFAQQSGSRLVLSSTNDLYENSPRPRKPDTVLDYSAFPLSHESASWYKSMSHYRNNFGNGRCLSGFYDSAKKTALIYAQYGTASDLTITTVSNAPTGLSIRSTPNQTVNGARLGMTIAQVKAIDGIGSLHSDGRYQRLTYNQQFTTSANVRVISYLGFLFANNKLVAVDVGGGV